MYPLLFELGPLNIYSYGVILGGSYFLALWYALQRARRAGLNEQRIVDLGLVGIFSAVVGAKLMLLVVDFDRYARDPGAVMGLMWVGGVFYGGLLLAVPMCWWYIRRKGLPLWTTCDLFAPGIALAQGVGRMGCLLAGCCYGRPTDAPWGITPRERLAVVALHELPDESDAAAVRAWVPSAAFRAAVRTVALSTVEFYVGVVDALVDDADGTLSGGETMH